MCAFILRSTPPYGSETKPKTEKVAKVKKEKVKKVPGQRGRKIDESSQRQLR